MFLKERVDKQELTSGVTGRQPAAPSGQRASPGGWRRRTGATPRPGAGRRAMGGAAVGRLLAQVNYSD